MRAFIDPNLRSTEAEYAARMDALYLISHVDPDLDPLLSNFCAAAHLVFRISQGLFDDHIREVEHKFQERT